MKTKLKAILFLLLFAMSIIIANIAVSAEELSAWDGTVDISWYNTTDDNFEISTGAQLAGLAAIVNGESAEYERDNFFGKTIKLTSDIILNSGNSGDFLVFPPANDKWTPIGKFSDGTDHDYSFSGTFDGDNHLVSGLYMYEWNVDSITSWNKGLFGSLNNATVKNLGVVNTCLRVYNGGGALAGLVQNSTIERCFTNNTAVYGNAMLGSFVGKMENSTIRNCFSTNGILADAYSWGFSNVAPFVGQAVSGEIENCYTAQMDCASPNKGIQGDVSFMPKNSYYEAEADGAGDYNGTAKSLLTIQSPDFVALLNENANADNIWQAGTADINNGMPVLTRFNYDLIKSNNSDTSDTSEETTSNADETTDETSDESSTDTEKKDTTDANKNTEKSESNSTIIVVIVIAAVIVIGVIVILIVKNKKSQNKK